MKVLFLVVTLFFSITLAQELSEESVPESALVSDDEELILGDDEDIIKANQQVTVDSAQKVSVPEATSPVSSPVVESKADDDELKLDGGEESILDAVNLDVGAADTSIIGSTVTSDSSAHSDTISASASVGSGAAANSAKAELKIEQPKVDTTFVKKNADPQIIGATGSINFAHNLKEYRSPKIAMLMSLIIPGTGQVYAAHHSWKAAIYGAVEVGMIATGIAINLKGQRKLKDAHKFADQHYSLDSYLSYQNVLKNNVSDSTYDDIFLSGTDTSFYNNAVNKNESYYSDLREDALPYIQGWDDVTPTFDENLLIQTDGYYSITDTAYLVYYGTDSTNARYGFSVNQKTYDSKVSRANSYFTKSRVVLTLMLLNHIVSAIDAGFSAKAHNDRLLNKQSVWQHIGLEQIHVATGGSMAPGYALKVRF